MGLQQFQQVPKLFYFRQDGKLALVVAKVVDDIKIAGIDNSSERFVKLFNEKYKLGEIIRGPTTMRFFGINIEQAEDRTLETNADDKLNNLTEYFNSTSRYK